MTKFKNKYFSLRNTVPQMITYLLIYCLLSMKFGYWLNFKFLCLHVYIARNHCVVPSTFP